MFRLDFVAQHSHWMRLVWWILTSGQFELLCVPRRDMLSPVCLTSAMSKYVRWIRRAIGVLGTVDRFCLTKYRQPTMYCVCRVSLKCLLLLSTFWMHMSPTALDTWEHPLLDRIPTHTASSMCPTTLSQFRELQWRTWFRSCTTSAQQVPSEDLENWTAHAAGHRISLRAVMTKPQRTKLPHIRSRVSRTFHGPLDSHDCSAVWASLTDVRHSISNADVALIPYLLMSSEVAMFRLSYGRQSLCCPALLLHRHISAILFHTRICHVSVISDIVLWTRASPSVCSRLCIVPFQTVWSTLVSLLSIHCLSLLQMFLRSIIDITNLCLTSEVVIFPYCLLSRQKWFIYWWFHRH